MERLFNFRPEGKEVVLNDETTIKLMVIRKGPRGIVAVLENEGPIILWDTENADTHLEDTEEQLILRLKEVR